MSIIITILTEFLRDHPEGKTFILNKIIIEFGLNQAKLSWNNNKKNKKKNTDELKNWETSFF